MATAGNSNLFDIPSGIQLEDACVVIVRTEWNAAIVDELEKGCRKILDEYKIPTRTIFVPGAFELPFGVKSFWETYKYTDNRPSAFIALGTVVRGDTPHFDYVCNAATDGIVQLNLQLPVPTIFGVLTVNTQEQAEERIGGKHGHKGEEAAITAIKMIQLQRSYKK